VFVRTLERLGCAGVNGDRGSAQLGGVEGVASGLLERDIAGYDGDGCHVDVRRAEGHN